jgi:hypothetical protein
MAEEHFRSESLYGHGLRRIEKDFHPNQAFEGIVARHQPVRQKLLGHYEPGTGPSTVAEAPGKKNGTLPTCEGAFAGHNDPVINGRTVSRNLIPSGQYPHTHHRRESESSLSHRAATAECGELTGIL